MEKFDNEKAAGGVETIAAAGDEQREYSTISTNNDNSTSAQRARLLVYLKNAPVDTLKARRELDILHPAARVMELRAEGKQIDTVRVMRPTNEGKLHSVALYVLQGEACHE